ncbi:aldo/keto reductase [Rhodoligotrophos defluvii]|uniref:aldo/keto reductase n=1 Tax=Rhodoligotrophos defluvii TaxID=2561934 RepID=UPI0010C9B774|nr:aldo/keto reductase [Rhodoligotrophos defluvii]
MIAAPTIALHDGHTIPQLGLGVWQTPADATAAIVQNALELGYRQIDTASIYGNETGVGEGIRASGVPRERIFLTTKLWNDDQGYDRALKAFDQSVARLGVDYVDLYLIHWPAPKRNAYVDSWRALIRLKEEGRTRSIGVSNFNPDHIERLIAETGVRPVLNQVELHPRFQRRDLREAHARYDIATQAWSPLGRGSLLGEPLIREIARKHGKTPAQVIIRWHLDIGSAAIPKSANPARIAENFAVFDFALDRDDLARLQTLDDPGGRLGPDPLTAPF